MIRNKNDKWSISRSQPAISYHANNNRSGSVETWDTGTGTGEDGVSFTMYKITWAVCLLNSFRYWFRYRFTSHPDDSDEEEEEKPMMKKKRASEDRQRKMNQSIKILQFKKTVGCIHFWAWKISAINHLLSLGCLRSVLDGMPTYLVEMLFFIGRWKWLVGFEVSP